MTILARSALLLRSVFRWTVRLLVPLFVVFVVAEQVEAHRLGAIAACESAPTAPENCLRQRGYLASAPYYPDITRRLLGHYARSLGGALGASYATPAEAVQ
ncbi:hypothetical protein [Hydrogenophaga sp.]|uniref:hypothetical protein n=1 Tax=Hydrogenophaga sp. TaxID=1904254 RepID=UPI003F6B7B06